jgi:hypothetical protein
MAAFRTFLMTDLVDQIFKHMKASGWKDDKEWTVGISHDAAARLAQRGQTDNPYVGVYQAASETVARDTERWLKTNFPRLQGDVGGGSPGKPPTQVYVFRKPRVQWRKP